MDALPIFKCSQHLKKTNTVLIKAVACGKWTWPVGPSWPSVKKISQHMPLCAAQTAWGGESSILSTILKTAYEKLDVKIGQEER